jgi:hypothetical protein
MASGRREADDHDVEVIRRRQSVVAIGPARVLDRLRLALPVAALALATALCLASPALAAEAPGNLDDMVTRSARTEVKGPVAEATYVATTAAAAAALLGTSRAQLPPGPPGGVYRVVMHGDVVLQDVGEGRGPYLAFLYWRDGDAWCAADFTVLQHSVALGSAGTPRAIEPFLIAHPTINRALPYVWAGLFYFLPAALLALAAVLCVGKRRSAGAYVSAACMAAAVAAWQAFVALQSTKGQSWDPVFHGMKAGVLAVVLCVDLAAVYVLVRRRPRPGTAGESDTERLPWLRAEVVLLIVAAVLCVVSLYLLATTGE